jgi:hypothetical protein
MREPGESGTRHCKADWRLVLSSGAGICFFAPTPKKQIPPFGRNDKGVSDYARCQ